MPTRPTFTTLTCQAGRHDACPGHIANPWWPTSHTARSPNVYFAGKAALDCCCTCHAWTTDPNLLFPTLTSHE